MISAGYAFPPHSRSNHPPWPGAGCISRLSADSIILADKDANPIVGEIKAVLKKQHHISMY
jgi:hypothetical protein